MDSVIPKSNLKFKHYYFIILAILIVPKLLKVNIRNPISINLYYLMYSSIKSYLLYLLVSTFQKNFSCYEDINNKLESQNIYITEQEEIIDDLRLLKHDYNNILQSINGYIVTKQYDQLAEHINHLSCDCKRKCNSKIINPNIINQPAIYGIIGSKYCKAINKNIDFKLNVSTCINEISFDFTELSKILGILLDNAIEACEKSENPHIYINFYFNKLKHADMIEIKNTISKNNTIDLNAIFKKGVSSKKIKSGLGLWEVKKIIESKRNSQIYTNINNNEFSQTIIVEKN